MYLTFKAKLKGLTEQEFYFFKSICRSSKDVYNATLYAVRQHYFKNKKYLPYYDVYHKVKKHHSYKELHHAAATQTMQAVDEAFQSFFALLKLKQQGQYDAKVNIPKYLDKDGYFPYTISKGNKRWGDRIRINVLTKLQHKYKLKKFTYALPEHIKGKEIKEISIVPKLNAEYFELHIVYKEQEKEVNELKTNNLGIDIGTNNFATCLDEQSGRAFILDGREVKSINRLYNKTKAKLQSDLSKQKKHSSKRILRMGDKRSKQMSEYVHQYSNFILKYCLNNNVGRVLIGTGWLAQNESNMGDQNNQNFTYIPFSKFADKLEYKLKLNGIQLERVEESYTSKCDHLAGEEMKHHETYLGKRVYRGLFKSSTGVTLNADVNGALGIMLKKGIGKGLITRLSSGCIIQPRRIRLREILTYSSEKLVKTMV